MATLRALISPLMQRWNLANLAGVTFGDKRDLYAALGYRRQLVPSDYRARYLRNGIAARIIDVLPQETWRGGGELVEDEDPETITELEEAWDALEQRLSMWSAFQRADILAGLGRYSVLLIGAPGEMSDPLPRGTGQEDVLYVTPFAEEDALIDTLVTDTTNPRFGLPEFYQLKRTYNSIQTPAQQFGRGVHWTRVLHISDGNLDDMVYGIPRLERVWNLLDDLEKVTGAGAEAFWLRAHQGYQFDLDKELELTPEAEAALKDETDEFAHGLKRMVRTRGVKMTTLGSDVADFKGPAGAILEQISAAIGIPQRVLLGSERGELASSQDQSSWDDQIHDRREAFAAPRIVRPFVARLAEFGYLPQVDEYEVRWPEIKNVDEAQRVDMAQKLATMNKSMGAIVITPDEIRDRVLELPPLADVDTEMEPLPSDVAQQEFQRESLEARTELARSRPQVVPYSQPKAAESKKKKRTSLGGDTRHRRFAS
jgi:hypothetical protein